MLRNNNKVVLINYFVKIILHHSIARCHPGCHTVLTIGINLRISSCLNHQYSTPRLQTICTFMSLHEQYRALPNMTSPRRLLAVVFHLSHLIKINTLILSSVVQLVARQTTDHYHLSSNLGVGISEGCFIFDFASLPLEVARPIQPTMCTKVAVKHQSSSLSSSTV